MLLCSTSFGAAVSGKVGQENRGQVNNLLQIFSQSAIEEIRVSLFVC